MGRVPLANFLAGEYKALPGRTLTEDTCRKWGYRVAEFKGERVHVCDLYDQGGTEIVAQKIRTRDKDFLLLGSLKKAGLYGQHLWRDKGKQVVITEGEIDGMSVSQLQQHKWPVVSVPNGAAGAAKAVARSLEWLLGFEHTILMFDNDEDGNKAANEVAMLFPAGRCKIARLPLKDANEMLVAGRGGEVINAMWDAKVFRPDGLVTIAEVKEQVLQTPEFGFPWTLPTLTQLTYGRRLGECYGLGAGTGVGKTDFITQQIAYDLSELKESVGYFAFEQQPVESVKRLAGKQASKRFHIPDGSWTQDELEAALLRLEEGGKLYLYDSFGATEWEVVRDRIRYLARAEGVRFFYVDHLTALAAEEDDERRGLERIMAQMGGLVKELNICIMFVSHLATPEGKPHEEGGRVMLKHLKGSRAIVQWAHYVFGLERNQQAEDEAVRTTTILRVLKDRYTGNATGKTIFLGYDQETGALSEKDEVSFEAATDAEESF